MSDTYPQKYVDGLNAEIAKLRQYLSERTKERDEHAKSAGQRWKELDAERQNHAITKRDMAESEARCEAMRTALESGQTIQFEGCKHQAIFTETVSDALSRDTGHALDKVREALRLCADPAIEESIACAAARDALESIGVNQK
jgi:hypothetical protein